MSEKEFPDLDDIKKSSTKSPQEDYAPPISPDAGQKMVETFNDIFTATTELSNLVNITLIELKKVTDVTERKNFEIREVIEQYNIAHKRIYATISQTQNYFDINKELIKDLGNYKRDIQKLFDNGKEEFFDVQSEYITKINLATEKIKNQFEHIALSIDIDNIVDVLQKEMENRIKRSKFNKFPSMVDRFEDSFIQLQTVLNELDGNKSKEGLLPSILSKIEKLNKNLDKMKININIPLLVITAIAAFGIGYAISFIKSANNYTSKFTSRITEETFKINNTYKNKINTLEKRLKAYSYIDKYKLFNNKVGIGFFDDTRKPYLYFSSNYKFYKIKNRYIVEVR